MIVDLNNNNKKKKFNLVLFPVLPAVVVWPQKLLLWMVAGPNRHKVGV